MFQYYNMSIPNVSLPLLVSTIRNKTLGNGDLESFNSAVMDFHLTAAYNIYNQVYFLSICDAVGNTTLGGMQWGNTIECPQLVNGKLTSGYSIFEKFIITSQPSLNQEFRRSC